MLNLRREYNEHLIVDEEYIKTLPDLQNGPSSLIKGANVPIEHVGIHNFKLPLKYRTKDNNFLTLETSVTGTVSLDADKKGINMSRIMRSFYEYKDEVFSISKLGEVLKSYKQKLDSFNARIFLNFSYPMLLHSLRSTGIGYQYYNITLEGLLDEEGNFKKFIHLDFVYSSTCPCSTELSLHAMENRNVLATPHSQRSIARVTIQFEDFLWIEDLIELCRKSLKTETQVLVKREDEQAFAELNGANVKFVEDAARLLYAELIKDERIIDFRIVCNHMESLHSHNAISIITKGIENGLTANVTNAIISEMMIKNVF